MKPLNLLCITPIDSIGDLKQRMESKFALTYVPDPGENDLAEFPETDVIFTNPNKSKVFLGEKSLNSLPKLKAITTASTGTVHIDQGYCASRNVTILSIKKEISTLENITSTAELAFGLTLAGVRNLIPAATSTLQGYWDYEPFVGRQLNGLTIGCVGFGRLGKMYARFAKSFSQNVLVCDPFKESQIIDADFESVGLKQLFVHSDVISLHIHAEGNEKIIDRECLNWAKDNLVLVNTSRGEIVDESALIDVMERKRGVKYMTDVLDGEIYGTSSNVLLAYARENMDRVVVTPHIGGMCSDAQILAYGRAFDMLCEYCNY